MIQPHAGHPLKALFMRLFTLILAVIVIGCSAEKPPEPAARVKISVALGGFPALLPELAKENGYFAIENLDASLVLLNEGRASLDALLKDEVQFCTTGEPPLAKAAWEGHALAVVGTLMTTDNATKILVSADSGIKKGSDLIGKKIATLKGGSPHFFLDQFLAKNRLRPSQVEILFLEGKALVPELTSGRIDGYAMTERLLLDGIKALGPKARLLEEPGLCMNAAYLVTKKKFLRENGQTVSRFLRAILRAEEAAGADENLLIRLYAETRKISDADARAQLTEQKHVLTLQQPVFLALEDNVKWVREKGLISIAATPNITSMIDPEPLRSLKPAAVRLLK